MVTTAISEAAKKPLSRIDINIKERSNHIVYHNERRDGEEQSGDEMDSLLSADDWSKL
ncbi:MAG: hypothetical protein AB1805_01515 [Nitrospirota bacterium]